MAIRRLVVVLAIAVVAFASASVPASAEPVAVWTRPVAGGVVRPFDPPESRFGAGHLGVDLQAAAGTPVHAAGSGVVAFAGAVAGTLHVVVAHAANLRTSYSFLATVAVRRGQHVERGDVVGTTGGIGQGHDGSVLHLGLRVGDDYVDPMLLFGAVDLATVVHLAPTTQAPRAASEPNERRGLLAGLAHDVGAARHIAGAALSAAGRIAGDASSDVRDALVAAGSGVRRVIATRFPLQAAAARAVAAWLAEQGHCDSHAPDADGAGGSDHRVMIVAGIDSSLDGNKPSLGLPVGALGYDPNDVSYFSYARDGGDYTPADTEGSLLDAARRLGAQLREMQRQDPGREVDLLGHSQGGVVVEAFLTLVYDPTDPSYPPLGTVVTLSSPLRGDPMATAITDIRRTHSGRAAIASAERLAHRMGLRLAAAGSNAVADLAEDSPLMRRLDAMQLPDEVQLTAIGAATDVVVPGTAATRPGAQGIVVLPHVLDPHSGIVHDPSALRTVRAALEDRPLPCQSLATILAGEIAPTAITGLEHAAGKIGELAGRIAGGRS